MGSPFDSVFAVSSRPVLQQHFGVTVSLVRGNTAPTVNVPVIPSLKNYEVSSQGGANTVVTSRDYRIKVARYVIGGSVANPQKGDRLTESIGGVSQVFEVMPIAGKQVAELSQDGLEWLVHTKRVT